MLQSVNELKGYEIEAADGRIGAVEDVYFDDERHAVRYLVVDTGAWLTGRRVLIPPPGVVRVDHPTRAVRVWMTRQQIEDSPDVDEDKPVSRQQEAQLYRYWGYPLYWAGPHPWGAGTLTAIEAGPGTTADLLSPTLPTADGDAEPHGDLHLRSAREVIGYRVAATDGGLGEVEDLIIDDDVWSLREIGIATPNGWLARTVRVPADAIDRIDWSGQTIHVRMKKSEVEALPDAAV